jgi:hypothetical protein
LAEACRQLAGHWLGWDVVEMADHRSAADEAMEFA